MKYIKPKMQIIIFTGIAIIFILSFFVIARYITKERKRQIDLTESRLIETTEHNAAMFRMIFDDYTDTLHALSLYIKNFDDYTADDTLEFLRNIAEAFDYGHMSINFPDRRSYSTTEGFVTLASDNPYLELIENGQFFITNVIDSDTDGTPLICVNVPLIKDGKAIASLGYNIEIEGLNNDVEILFPNNGEYFCIVDENGRYIFTSNGENLTDNSNFFENIDKYVYAKGFNKEMMEKSFINLTSGYIEYSVNGETYYGNYAPVGINNWVMFTKIPKNIVDADTNKFVVSSLILSAQIALIIFVISSFVFYQQNRMRITTELNERCFHILAEHTGKIILEWNYREKLIYYSNIEKVVGRQLPQNKLKTPDDIINAGMIYQDDYDVFRKLFFDISNGQTIENARIRLCSIEQNYEYYSVSTIVVSDTKGKPYKSIGFLENIDKQVRKEENLLQKANIDQLTGLYNKSAAEQSISEILSSDTNANHALFCIDLDNFKNINDTFGHLYGDKVLKELSSGIKELFRKSDILGRFGGDEFVIFVPNIPNIEFIEAKAAELNKCFHRTYRDGDTELTVSASIGIALSPKNGDTYKTLYKNADEAAYKVKTSGKNAYIFSS